MNIRSTGSRVYNEVDLAAPIHIFLRLFGVISCRLLLGIVLSFQSA